MHTRLNCSEKLGQLLFGGHKGRILRILLLFLCALGVLVGIYRARGNRLIKLNPTNKITLQSPQQQHSTTKWVIVGNPDDENNSTNSNYVCGLATVAKETGWKTIIIGDKINCCRLPDCYPIHSSQFLRMSYKSASVLKKLIDVNKGPYKESVRNLAYIWVIHRGARFIFDAYLQEYINARTPIEEFTSELRRQLQTLALDDSLALVEDRGRRQQPNNLFRNPYAHFGRPDLSLIHNQQNTLKEFNHFRICEVRPPSIEKFLETDDGWWDTTAPALVLPGDTMPPLCTRNTLFSPDVFWALPLLPDHSQEPEMYSENSNLLQIPPWYIRGLWSQSLLGDLGGSIRLSLNRIPTINGSLTPPTFVGKHLKRWHCRSRSTYRCLSLISKELLLKTSPSEIIEAWITDLKSIHYSEPHMLPRRRSQSNPCLGADGLHGVSFFPQIKPTSELSESERNQTLFELRFDSHDSSGGFKPIMRVKRTATDLFESGSVQRSSVDHGHEPDISLDILPPLVNASYYVTNWTMYNSTEIEPELIKNSVDSSYFPDFVPQTDPKMSKFNLLKTITENLCPGYSKLIPNFKRNLPPRASKPPLLIINFKNHHYDLLPTFEVLYRSTFPTILYCGHPHVSIDLFMKKYQSVEERSFNFLPTYTKASYECLLGAMEINFDVGGYLILTDESIVKSWTLNFSKDIIVAEVKREIVDQNSWANLDSKGMKLPKLIDGLINSFKLFSFILQGGNSHTIHKRDVFNTAQARDYNAQAQSYSEQFNSAQLNNTEQIQLIEDSLKDKIQRYDDMPLPVNSEELPLQNKEEFNETNDYGIEVGDEFEEMENATKPPPPLEELYTTPTAIVIEANDSAVLPLYHVEHGGTEQPTPPTWHKPISGEEETTTDSYVQLNNEDSELKKEMEHLLDALQSVFKHMMDVGRERLDFEQPESHQFDSHRISPREFRHIRCSHVIDSSNSTAHSDPLCYTLRSFILNLATPLGTYPLLQTTTPIYYIPAHLSKPFYSVANVLLHFNVLDELALPLLFKGLALNPVLQMTRGNIESNSQFVHPFNHHKIYQDKDKQFKFCNHFLQFVL